LFFRHGVVLETLPENKSDLAVSSTRGL